jgi:two-component system, OmpR family, alkaline phosphatase synthesis response regulator PhoP
MFEPLSDAKRSSDGRQCFLSLVFLGYSCTRYPFQGDTSVRAHRTKIMKEHVLLVEDEEALRMALSDRLRREGYLVECAPDGNTGFQKATCLPFDLMILDIMLPGRNGLDLCRDIRIAGVQTPILLLTARDETVDKVVGLKVGADDYVTKPFDMLELTARVEVLLRRRPSGKKEGIHQFGSLRVDVRATSVAQDGVPIHLSAREFHLLLYFIEHRGTTLSRNQILQDVWGYDAATLTRTVDMHVASLRQKLEKDPKRPVLILTVAGLGYRFAS